MSWQIDEDGDSWRKFGPFTLFAYMNSTSGRSGRFRQVQAMEIVDEAAEVHLYVELFQDTTRTRDEVQTLAMHHARRWWIEIYAQLGGPSREVVVVPRESVPGPSAEDIDLAKMLVGALSLSSAATLIYSYRVDRENEAYLMGAQTFDPLPDDIDDCIETILHGINDAGYPFECSEEAHRVATELRRRFPKEKSDG